MTKKLLAGATALAFLAGIGAASAQTKPQDQKSGAETAPSNTQNMRGTGGTGTSNPQAKPEDQKSGSETSVKKQKEGN
jgi:hypothetical protein